MPTTSTSLITTSKGEFESCFAVGLDLSEFDNQNAPNKPTTSAAAELLQVKKLEREQRMQEEAAEEKMKNCIRQQISTLRSSQQRRTPGNMLVDALVKMHGGDTDDPRHRTIKMGKQRGQRRTSSQSSRTKAVKKSRRIKHSR
ncbi:unnamed protein product [Cylindrotheca closterium]|uniref:Uncharacterized protein n=1 Tax=Cylindrotheca closterium TaxID=2856 RepID=A0AAD2FFN3_9STRA|nr:unnamed protein product [Cylindrotheca closterium]